MINATVGQFLVNSVLPEELRDYSRVLDGSGIKSLLQTVARNHPDKYRDVSHGLNQVGLRAAQDQGGMSFGARHLLRSKAANVVRDRIQLKLRQILADDSLSDKARNEQIIKAVGNESMPQIKAVLEEAVQNKNPLGTQVMSGTRGKAMNLASLVASDMLYSDHHDEVIPIPVLRSYSEGLSPEEYWAGTYGARRGIMATKFATQEAGFLSKQLNQAGHRLVVMGEDTDEVEGTPLRGMIADTDDSDNEGALLAQDTGPYKKNTPLTPKILSHLKRLDKNRILVRSPIIGGSPEGGVYARDVGIRESGGLPGRGEQVGLQAAQALSEPISQGQLCLAEGTLVRMADWSVKAIEDIQPGEQVIGSDRAGALFPVSVVRRYYNGVRECVRTTFSLSRTKERVTLVSTVDHKILANARRWHPETELVDAGVWPVGEKCVRLCAVMPRAVHHDGGTTSEPAALLLGLLLGDGCYTESVHGVHLSCFDPTLIADIEPMLTRLQLKATLLAGQKGYYRLSQLKDVIRQCSVTGRTLPGDRNPILIKLKELGLYGKYAHEKTLPDGVWTWDRDSLLDLIAGLLATDGSVYTGANRRDQRACYVNYASTSLTMLHTLRELLRVRFAVHAGTIHAQNNTRKRPLYSFTITRQQEVSKLRTLLADRIPGCKRALLNATTAFTSSVDTNFFYRQEQEIVDDLPTYDIEVDHPDHLFVLANGLIVSNSAKHSGGVAGQEKAVGGFQYINQLIQTPKKMQGGAAHATTDGQVQRIEPAPAGGHNVIIGGQPHYVASGFDLKVKQGDTIEAGDLLSDGIPNPAIITQYKGVGEGRRYFVNEFRKAMSNSGMRGHRRNIELLARGLINHVKLTEETADNAPDDIVPYSTLEHTYKPREGHEVLGPKKAIGQYLEKPVLHYTIGTKIKPSMIRDFDEFGVSNITVHKNPPPFEPHMVRGMYQLQHDPDWLTQMYGSGLKQSLLDSVARGATSDARGTSFVSSLVGGTDFGEVADRAVVRPQKPYAVPNVPLPKLDEPAAPVKFAFFGGKYAVQSKPVVKAAVAPTQPKAPASATLPAPTAGTPPSNPSSANDMFNSNIMPASPTSVPTNVPNINPGAAALPTPKSTDAPVAGAGQPASPAQPQASAPVATPQPATPAQARADTVQRAKAQPYQQFNAEQYYDFQRDMATMQGRGGPSRQLATSTYGSRVSLNGNQGAGYRQQGGYDPRAFGSPGMSGFSGGGGQPTAAQAPVDPMTQNYTQHNTGVGQYTAANLIAQKIVPKAWQTTAAESTKAIAGETAEQAAKRTAAATARGIASQGWDDVGKGLWAAGKAVVKNPLNLVKAPFTPVGMATSVLADAPTALSRTSGEIMMESDAWRDWLGGTGEQAYKALTSALSGDIIGSNVAAARATVGVAGAAGAAITAPVTTTQTAIFEAVHPEFRKGTPKGDTYRANVRAQARAEDFTQNADIAGIRGGKDNRSYFEYLMPLGMGGRRAEGDDRTYWESTLPVGMGGVNRKSIDQIQGRDVANQIHWRNRFDFMSADPSQRTQLERLVMSLADTDAATAKGDDPDRGIKQLRQLNERQLEIANHILTQNGRAAISPKPARQVAPLSQEPRSQAPNFAIDRRPSAQSTLSAPSAPTAPTPNLQSAFAPPQARTLEEAFAPPRGLGMPTAGK